MKNLEIERKFLVSPNLDFDTLPVKKRKRIMQGYIYIDSFTEIRVRSVETCDSKKYVYTVKISGNNELARIENEFEISEEKFNQLIENVLSETNVIVKDRLLVELPNNLTAELDIFYGEHEGLTLVEVEFSSQEEANSFEKPIWFGEDVTSHKEYKNKNLAKSTKKKITRKRELK